MAYRSLRARLCVAGLSVAMVGLGMAAEPERAGDGPEAAGRVEIGYDPQAPVQVKLDAIEQEVARLRRAGAEGRAKSLAEQVGRLRDRWEGKAAESQEAEVHVAGVYEGLFPDGPRKFGRVTVELEVADAPVILVLCAYEPIRWDVRVGRGVKVKRLILAGYGEQELAAPLAGVAAETYTHKGKSDKYFYAYNRMEDSEGGYRRATEIIRELTGSEIRTLVGEYRPKGALVVGPRNEDWRRQRVLGEAEPLYMEATAMSRARQRERWAGLKFQAINWTVAQRFRGTAEWGDFTPAGPIEGTLRALPQGVSRVAVDPRGPTYYTLMHGLARFDPANNKLEKLEIEGDIPELSWPCGVAFDTKRRRVVIVSLGGEGFMYSFDAEKDDWALLRSMDNIDLESLTYSADEDCFYGVGAARGADRRPAIHVFDAAGDPVKLIRPSMPIVGDRMMMHQAPTQVVSLGEYIAVLTAAADGGPMSVMMIEKKTGRTEHAGAMRSVAPVRGDVGEEELARLWKELGDGDAAGAAKAELALAGAGKRAVEFIRPRLIADPTPVDGAEVNRLVKQLDAERVQDRERALAALREMGGVVEPNLRKAKEAGLSAEAATRVELLLRQMGEDEGVSLDSVDALSSADARREGRAIRALARIGAPAAVEVLREVAAGPGGLARTRYARGALREP